MHSLTSYIFCNILKIYLFLHLLLIFQTSLLSHSRWTRDPPHPERLTKCHQNHQPGRHRLDRIPQRQIQSRPTGRRRRGPANHRRLGPLQSARGPQRRPVHAAEEQAERPLPKQPPCPVAEQRPRVLAQQQLYFRRSGDLCQNSKEEETAVGQSRCGQRREETAEEQKVAGEEEEGGGGGEASRRFDADDSVEKHREEQDFEECERCFAGSAQAAGQVEEETEESETTGSGGRQRQ